MALKKETASDLPLFLPILTKGGGRDLPHRTGATNGYTNWREQDALCQFATSPEGLTTHSHRYKFALNEEAKAAKLDSIYLSTRTFDLIYWVISVFSSEVHGGSLRSWTLAFELDDEECPRLLMV